MIMIRLIMQHIRGQTTGLFLMEERSGRTLAEQCSPAVSGVLGFLRGFCRMVGSDKVVVVWSWG